jgi:hypothetical protein
MDIDHLKQQQMENASLRANLIGASLAGLAVGYALWMESVSSYEPVYRIKDYAENAAIALTCYVAATFLVHHLLLKGLRATSTRWAVIALTGSILIVGYTLLIHYIVMATHPEAWASDLKQPISKVLFRETTSALGFSLVFTSLYTITALPIMAIIHYGARMSFLSRSET